MHTAQQKGLAKHYIYLSRLQTVHTVTQHT